MPTETQRRNTENDVRVSVIVPAFNAAATVAESVQSVLRQAEGRLEVIVVDDCSTDGTAAVVERLAAVDRRVRLIRLATNRGAGGARNAAMDAARGEWVALLDADDRYDERRLERLLALGERTGADIVSDNLVLCQRGEADGEVVYSAARIPCEKRLTGTEFLVQNTKTGNGKRAGFVFMKTMIRRAFLLEHGIRYDESVRCGEDFVFYMVCLVGGAAWWITPEPLYYYSLHAGSVTDSVTPGDLRMMSAFEHDLLQGEMAARDGAFASALRRHKGTVDHWRYTMAFKGAMRRGEFGAALRAMFESWGSLQSIVRDVGANLVFGVIRKGGRARQAV